jgi:putative ABC transport system ATP-binding protein
MLPAARKGGNPLVLALGSALHLPTRQKPGHPPGQDPHKRKGVSPDERDRRMNYRTDTGAGRAPGRQPADALVSIGKVTKRYVSTGQPALDGVSLQVAQGEAVAVMGPSGSGKSTLLNLIAGLDKPTSGTVAVAGQRVDSLSETRVARFRRQHIGMIFQFFNLLDDLTVADNVLLPAQLAGIRRSRARARAGELLERLGIARYSNTYPGRLSGGECQRVAIARALINSPTLLLADEPTGALDTANGEAIGQLLLDLNAGGQTLILVTHSPELAARYAQRTIHFLDGRIASDTHGPHRGTPAGTRP